MSNDNEVIRNKIKDRFKLEQKDEDIVYNYILNNKSMWTMENLDEKLPHLMVKAIKNNQKRSLTIITVLIFLIIDVLFFILLYFINNRKKVFVSYRELIEGN